MLHAEHEEMGRAVEQKGAPAHCAERREERLANGKCNHEVDRGRKALRTSWRSSQLCAKYAYGACNAGEAHWGACEKVFSQRGQESIMDTAQVRTTGLC